MGRILVVGASGQTGSYLARTLLRKGFDVVGSSRDLSETNFWRLHVLNIRESVPFYRMDPTDSQSVRETLARVRPSTVFFLGGQSSVGASFKDPNQTRKSIADAVNEVLEGICFLGLDAVFVNSASTDMFGNQLGVRLTESHPMRPMSPYATAKLESFRTTIRFRETHDLPAFNAILSNHESPLRGENFVSRKVVSQLREVRAGQRQSLELGNIDIERDWMWAGDVARALSLLAELPSGDDFLIASGQSHTLGELVEGCAAALGLEKKINVEKDLMAERPSDVPSVRVDPSKFMNTTGWTPEFTFREMVGRLARGDL